MSKRQIQRQMYRPNNMPVITMQHAEAAAEKAMELQEQIIRKQDNAYADFRVAVERLKYSILSFKLLKTEDSLRLLKDASGEMLKKAGIFEDTMLETLKQYLDPEYMSNFIGRVNNIRQGVQAIIEQPSRIDELLNAFNQLEFERDFITAVNNSKRRQRDGDTYSLAAAKRVDELILTGKLGVVKARKQAAEEMNMSPISVKHAHQRYGKKRTS